MRCFIAVDLPDDIRNQIHVLQKSFEGFASLSLVNTKQLHSTLLFLGDMDQSMVEKAKSLLAGVTRSHGPVKCHLEGVGVFPDRDYMRVIWVAIIDAGALSAIQGDIESSFQEHSLYESSKGFRAHITIARVRGPGNKSAILSVMQKNMDFKTGFFEIDKLKLKESILLPGGPKYHDIASYTLRESA